MARVHKIAIILLALMMYVTGYAVCRSRGELIHRMTWSGGWAYHSIVPGSFRNRISFLVSIPEEDLRYVYRIESRRRMFQIFYLPLIMLESAMQWVLVPRIRG